MIRPSNWILAEVHAQDLTPGRAAYRLGVSVDALEWDLHQANVHAPTELVLRLGQLLGLQPSLVRDYCTNYHARRSA